MIVVIAMPTLAVVTALAALVVLGRRLDNELTGLRRSLRLAGAAAVAADELRRTSAVVAAQATTAGEQARLRLRRPRSVGRRHAL